MKTESEPTGKPAAGEHKGGDPVGIGRHYCPNLSHADRRLRRKHIAAGFRAGKTIATLADEHNVTRGLVVTALKEFCGDVYKVRQQEKKTVPPVRKSVERNLDWSKTDSELARQSGLSRERIRQLRRAAGQKPNNPLRLRIPDQRLIETLDAWKDEIPNLSERELLRWLANAGFGKISAARVRRYLRVNTRPYIVRSKTLLQALHDGSVLDSDSDIVSKPLPGSGCRLWLGAAKTGRPGVCKNGVQVYAIRELWEVGLKRGSLHGRNLKRLCKNPMCMNPDHYELRRPV